MTRVNTLGFPRIGAQRELKRALEAHWRGELDAAGLEAVGRELRARHWAIQAEAGVDLLPVGDFSWYDHVLDMSVRVGAVPPRFGGGGGGDLATYFRMARGDAHTAPCEMTKWFDTNYHYLVPELAPDQVFRLDAARLLTEVAEARALGHAVKPVLVGPLSFLWLAKLSGEGDKLDLLEALVPVYSQLLVALREAGAEWVQLDEPILALDLPVAWRGAFESAYTRLRAPGLRVLVATYFGALEDNLGVACNLAVDGLHVDLARAPEQLSAVIDRIGPYKVLSAGVVDGRNVWRTDLNTLLDALEPAAERLGERLWLAPSCSLLHVPLDVDLEPRGGVDAALRPWLAFAKQKLEELRVLRHALDQGRVTVASALRGAQEVTAQRRRSARTCIEAVRARVAALGEARRGPVEARRARQREVLPLPPLPATTIGSFPQTPELRAARAAHRLGTLSEADYHAALRAHIERTVRLQERLDLDVLVHGEAERTDMVEYFAEQLDGYAVTRQGWVQSYGSRCVRPPILYGDVRRPRPMTVAWTAYARSLTERPLKGMLTGPVTLLQWSFVRDDLPRADCALQLATALQDEVRDLEAAGLPIVQIDEPALREGLPLRRAAQAGYRRWAARAFRVAACGASDAVQVHTHMCYSDFEDILDLLAELDADVISLEAARSDMSVLRALGEGRPAYALGPGVYDIHAPRVPDVPAMEELVRLATRYLPIELLWVNPDCGLKTRDWAQVESALANMVSAAKAVRSSAAAAAAS